MATLPLGITLLGAPAATAAPQSDLADRALRGDEAAWNALVAKHNQRVVVALLGRGLGLERAKDIAQEAWLRLLEQQRAGRLRELRLPQLAITQATFLALDDQRKNGRTLALADGFDAADPAPLPSQQLIGEEQLARAQRVLAKCSPSARKVFSLVYGGGNLSHADVASRVGLSVQRVRQIVCEVRKELRREFEEDGDV
ncbi:MAG TPA: RNA polymerase sigma factor [Polyangiaceae bacterium]|jgi:RNA polymerase sigma-70 factor (ECF subfamily)